MTDYTTPTTELEAVNTILSVMGESPVSSLEEIEGADVQTALNVLREVSRRVQLKGWHWNTEISVPLTPNAITSKVALPANCLRVDEVDISKDVIQRGEFLYDRNERSYEFTQTVTLDYIALLDFTDLPEAARDYITIRAARTNQSRQLGSITLGNFTQYDELDAKLALETAEAETADYNILTGNPSTARLYENRRR